MTEPQLRRPPTPVRLTGGESVKPDQRGDGDPSIDLRVRGFWQWAFSDLLSNTLRGVFAEWLVASATGTAGGMREEWAPHDVSFGDISIEVKSAAYVQSWAQRGPSRIEFAIAPTKAWDPQTGRSESTQRRQADVYVFCLLAEEEPKKVNLLDLAQWRFFVLATRVLDERVPTQKTIALSSLLGMKPVETSYADLRSAIVEAVRLPVDDQ